MEKVLDYVDGFMSMDLNVIECLIRSKVKRDFCFIIRNGTDNSITIFRPSNGKEPLIVEHVSKKNVRKTNKLRQNSLVTALGENLTCCTNEQIKIWKINLLDHNTI